MTDKTKKKPLDLSHLVRLGMAALPTDDDEWGSDRQVEAANAFHAYADAHGLIDEQTSEWLLKATEEEAVAAVIGNAMRGDGDGMPHLLDQYFWYRREMDRGACETLHAMLETSGEWAVEATGGGCVALRYDRNGREIWLTCSEQGGEVPNWQGVADIGFYPDEDSHGDPDRCVFASIPTPKAVKWADRVICGLDPWPTSGKARREEVRGQTQPVATPPVTVQASAEEYLLHRPHLGPLALEAIGYAAKYGFAVESTGGGCLHFGRTFQHGAEWRELSICPADGRPDLPKDDDPDLSLCFQIRSQAGEWEPGGEDIPGGLIRLLEIGNDYAEGRREWPSDAFDRLEQDASVDPDAADKLTVLEYIAANRRRLQDFIASECGWDVDEIDDDEIEHWIANCEPLYFEAQEAGVLV